jgi:branched-chain amino acid transport system permease protein
MDALLHQVFSGIASGGIYAGLALALVMIYQSTGHINFAQGEMAMFSTYIAWELIDYGTPYWGAFFLTLFFAFAAGVAIERLVIRPFHNLPVIALIIVFIGLLVIVNSTASWIFGTTLKTFPSPFPADPLWGNHYISNHELGSIGVVLVIVAILFVFFRYTALGLAMRAVAENPVSSRLVGIRVGWMLALGWGLAAAIGAVSGMMVAPILYLDSTMMGGVLIYSLAGAILGGLDNPWGAALGGFIIGVMENVLGAYVIGTQLKLSVALIVIVVVLLVRPSGLFGRTVVTRV